LRLGFVPRNVLDHSIDPCSQKNDFHAILQANAGMGSMGRLNCLRGLQRPFRCVFLALRR
jgi:hypothetical protein